VLVNKTKTKNLSLYFCFLSSDPSKDFHMSQSTIGSGRENTTDVSSISAKDDYREKVWWYNGE